MSHTSHKIGGSHLQRAAFVYIRQSSVNQIEHNRESIQRQYALAQRAVSLGWHKQQVSGVGEDLGLSGARAAHRGGFARNNADWYRLLDLCSLTDTLIGDADGVYNPASFNDRLLLGLKGTMSEAE